MDNGISVEKIQDFVVSHRLIVIFILGPLILTIIHISLRAKLTTVVFKVKSPTNYEDNSVKNCLIQSKYLDQNCHWYFLNYTPSAWESSWTNNIDELQKVVCETLADRNNSNKSALAVERLMELQKFGRNHSESNKQSSDVLLSRMFYQKECIDPITNVSSKGVIVSQLIEPLIGLLRDPLTICNRIGILPASAYEGAVTQSKRFFLLSVAAPFYIHSSTPSSNNNIPMMVTSNKRNTNLLPWMYERSKLNSLDTETEMRNGQNILFDLGSSYFGSWNGDTSAGAGRWFYENYKRFGIKFDRIIAYEYELLNLKNVWNELPDGVFPVYTLINVGCEKSGKLSPWTNLKALAKPYDHVVVKLDIDTPAIEGPLINEVLNDSSIHSLIDELFFEHHITVKEMTLYWMTPPGSLKDSYILFTKLRQLGIRMHSWP
ncbi:unnamed protein product [Adineta steineri]|uniref:Uncharacterized protein n=1 Tax=Adineta steineri TaxID=433720 RepID=A0A819JCP5_9BILA|nr:unnamed protein product [Adineta steineri]CAF3931712.1 unnamed protein product [Adineta steineri]